MLIRLAQAKVLTHPAPKTSLLESGVDWVFGNLKHGE